MLLGVGIAFTVIAAVGQGSDPGSSGPGASAIAPPYSDHWSIHGNSFGGPGHSFYLGTADFNPLVFKTDGLLRMVVSEDGEVDIVSGLTVGERLSIGEPGPDEMDTLLHVKGNGTFDGDHIAYFESTGSSVADGIAIQLSGATPDNANNFVTFYNGSGGVVGRIEGQTLSELQDSQAYKFEQAVLIFDVAQAVFNEVAAVVCLAIPTTACGAALVVAAGIEIVETEVNLIEFYVYRDANPGVAYESGAGDYAEWLEKADPAEDFSSGDVVGVRAGKISKDTAGADHYMVISESPIVLGNMPAEDRRANFEKVAFMGQVRVKVAGAVSKGDYILPSSRNNGFGIAVSPKDMILRAYAQIVGVAWEDSVGKGGLSYINTAVGINANDLVARMIQQQEEIDSLKRSMNTVLSYLQSGDRDFSAKQFEIESTERWVEQLEAQATRPPADEITRMVALLRDNPYVVEGVLADTRAELTARGIDFGRYEQTRRILTDPEYLIDVLEGYGTE